MRVLFVINPAAGPGHKDWNAIVHQWASVNPQYNIYTYQLAAPEFCITEISKLIHEYQIERVVAAGGDGTVKLVAGIVAGTPLSLAILPAGSANGMATELGIPSESFNAITLAVTGKAAPADMIKINGEWCIHLSDMGLNALLLHYFEMVPDRGKLGYVKAFFKMIFHSNYTRRIRLNILADDVILYRKAVMVIIANATRYGTGATINPNGRINDGRFELIIIYRLRLNEMIKMLITRKPFNPWNIETIPCRRLSIRSRPSGPFQVDGEYRGKHSLIEAEIAPGILNMVYPVQSVTGTAQ